MERKGKPKTVYILHMLSSAAGNAFDLFCFSHQSTGFIYDILNFKISVSSLRIWRCWKENDSVLTHCVNGVSCRKQLISTINQFSNFPLYLIRVRETNKKHWNSYILRLFVTYLYFIEMKFVTLTAIIKLLKFVPIWTVFPYL